jgi:hypothetical protein
MNAFFPQMLTQTIKKLQMASHPETSRITITGPIPPEAEQIESEAPRKTGASKTDFRGRGPEPRILRLTMRAFKPRPDRRAEPLLRGRRSEASQSSLSTAIRDRNSETCPFRRVTRWKLLMIRKLVCSVWGRNSKKQKTNTWGKG